MKLVEHWIKRWGYIPISKLSASPELLLCIRTNQILRKNFLIASTSDKRTPHTDRGLSCNNKSKTDSLMGKYINAGDKVTPAA